MYQHIKRFIDKISIMESKKNKDVVLPISDARGLRDEVSKLLADLYELQGAKEKAQESEVIQIEIKGRPFNE